ncbi:recombinase family protein [Streptomyces violascens]|uniref:Serine recombinase n=1 Tax=Streptomyces violascens TaxID=67381 RepID=A0ABQ3QXF2_9ACTN|nr:recombinase family protein [Streptomyces violascens]GGU13460.1 serine recombinase [Streptomyces violascens]GHI41945.1 serine recombinase [Streptomyces violascens]
MDHEPADPQLAVMYCRISEDREGGGLAVERQRQDCDQLAAQLGLRVVRVYEDNDLSAYSGKPRPDYDAMLNDLRAGMAGTVLAWHTDRLHRSPVELEEYIDVCESRRIATHTVKAGLLDLTTATGRMIARQLGVQARYEVERMIERQKRAREQKIGRGEYCGGPRPFGWESDGETPIPEEIDALNEAADSVLAGASLRSIATDWGQRGIRTSTGAYFEGGSLRRVLLRPRNAGIVVHLGREAGPAIWDAAIEESKWRSVCALLKDPSRIPAASNVRRHLGSGLYVCGPCSSDMKSGSKGTGQKDYHCRANKCVSRDLIKLDDYVQLAIFGRLSRPDAAQLLAERKDPVDVRGAQETMHQARAMLDDFAAALGAGDMDMQEWRTASAAARARLRAAEAELSQAEKVNPVVGLIGAPDLDVRWAALDLSRRRSVLDFLMTVRVFPARPGRQPDGGYWDAGAIQIEWK